MSKTKIALLIDWYLPGTKAGGPVRSVHSLVNLLKDIYDFYLITSNHDLGEQAPYKNIKADTIFNAEGVNYYYFSKASLTPDNMLQLIKGINPDLVYLNSFWSYHFSINIVRFKSKNILAAPVLLAPRGMLGKGALGLKSFKKRLYLFIAKKLGWYKHIFFHATQIQEEKDILSEFANARISIAPNINSLRAKENKMVKNKNHLRLFYLSRVAKVKNLHFALEVLSSIPSQYNIEYDIYGNIEDKDYWLDCKKIIERLPQNIRVTYIGELNFDHVHTAISNYHGLLLPTLNENFGHSIAESLLCGCLVIISDQTPWNDVNASGAGYAIDLNSPAKFSKAIVELTELNQQEFSTRSTAAINYIRTKIKPELTTAQYKNLFDACVKN